MAARKPNKTTWIILAVVLGWIFLCVVFIVESRDVLAEPVTHSTRAPDIREQDIQSFETKQTIFVDGSNDIFVNNQPVENLDVLLSMIQNLELGEPSSTIIVFRIHEHAQSKVLLQVKDTLDDAGYEIRIEVLMTEND